MNFANVKELAGKGTLVALAMGAVFFVGAAKAQAQVAVGVQFGAPAYAYPQTTYYAAPGLYGRDAYLGHRQMEAVDRRDAIIRHEQWEHARDFDRRLDDRRFARDDHHFDRRWR